MRLSADQIKEALLHEDIEIRQAAAEYFARSYSPDTSIMLRVIEAIRQYGWQDAFDDDGFLGELAQSEESIDWILEGIGQGNSSDSDTSHYVAHVLTHVLLATPPHLLLARQEQIRAISWLNDECWPDFDVSQAFETRLRLASLPAEELWAEFERFSPDKDDDADEPNVEDYLDSLADAMTPHSAALAERILEILAEYEPDHDDLRLLFAVRVAGNMRLPATVPTLTRLAADDDTGVLYSALQRAFAQIGSDSVVEALVAMYPKVSPDKQLSTAFYLEGIPSDRSAEACLQLAAQNSNSLVDMRLLQAALMNFATEAIEPAAQLLRTSEPDENSHGLLVALLIACKLSGKRFAEYDDWLADVESDIGLLGWYRSRGDYYDDGEFEEDALEEGEFAEGEFDDEEFEDDEIAEPAFDLPYDVDDVPESPPTTIVKQVPQVGRNEPCPCGSGKKFKKCCYQKMSAENAADAVRVTEAPMDFLSAFGKGLTPGANSQSSPKPPQPTSACYEIKLTLDGIKLPIWRRIVVPDMTLDLFHSVIQVTMGWHHEHLYQFTDGKTNYTVPAEYGAKDAGLTLLSTIVQGKRKRFEYMYDFGDSWRHSINVERILLPEEATPHAVCLEGENACPIEDIGGTYGYANLLEAYENPELHDSIEGWDFNDEDLEFDPKAFDRDAVNARLERFTAETAR